MFPCGAYFPVPDGDEILDAAHRAKDGAYRISVYPSSQPHLDENGECLARVKKLSGIDYKGARAPCLWMCPAPRRRKEEWGYDQKGERGVYVSCFARLYAEGKVGHGPAWVDITPHMPSKCPHCEEQRTFVAECQRRAKSGEEGPVREQWRKCSRCEKYKELHGGTGRCASCQIVTVLIENYRNQK